MITMMIELMCECPFCGKPHSVVVPEEGYDDWQNGALIQDALPMLSPTEREQLISQMCPKCQKSVFGGGD